MTLKTNCQSVYCLLLPFICLRVISTTLTDSGFLTLGDNVETRRQLHGQKSSVRHCLEFRVSTIYLCVVRVEI
ncbi:MAG: hypothetical protein HXY43_00545 [Fischerella sp.]|uniref:hypothetical protein n=1 Tax=Fischerella sp. TaxID=1191 RepID=UPI0018234C95|nr:hypothetical protein [Fischerella sp.]NWF57840.1 hypothetical protein [Fischerella sp.]